MEEWERKIQRKEGENIRAKEKKTDWERKEQKSMRKREKTKKEREREKSKRKRLKRVGDCELIESVQGNEERQTKEWE